MKRILLIAAGVVAILAIAAALVLPAFLNPERYRPRVEQMLSGMTGRKVAIGPMRLRVFPLPEITADGFTLDEDPAFGAEPFLKAARVAARVRLLPLFSSKLDVVSFDIDKPAAHLRRDARGRWNLAGLMKQAASGVPKTEGPAAGGGFEVVIERFRLVDGSVDLVDETGAPGKPLRLEARKIDLTLSDLSTTTALGVALAFDLAGSGRVSIDGRFGPPPKAEDGAWPVDAEVRLGKAAVKLRGALSDVQGKPKADVRAVVPKVAFQDVAPVIALFGPFLPRGLAKKGELSLDATVRGPVAEPLAMAIEGTATVSGLELSDPSIKEPVRDIGATLKLAGDRAELRGLTASLGRSRIQGSCTVSRFAHPVLDVELTVPLLDVDEILSFLPAGGGPSPAPSNAPAGSLLRDVTVRGTLLVNEAKAMNLKLTGARARLDVAGGEAHLRDVAAKLYGGTLAGDVTAGLADPGPPFAMTAKVAGVDFNGLCTDFSKDLAGLIHGTLDSSLDVKGRGLDTAALRSRLTGGAAVALRNGKLTSFGFLKQLAQVLEAAGGRGIGKDETPFDSLTGTFDICDGRATTQDLALVSPDLDINGKGSIGLDQSIAMNVGVVLSQPVSADMVAKTARLSVLKNAKGQLALDLKVGGTLQKPAIGADPKMLQRVAEETLKKKGADALRKLFERRKP